MVRDRAYRRQQMRSFAYASSGISGGPCRRTGSGGSHDDYVLYLGMYPGDSKNHTHMSIDDLGHIYFQLLLVKDGSLSVRCSSRAFFTNIGPLIILFEPACHISDLRKRNPGTGQLITILDGLAGLLLNDGVTTGIPMRCRSSSPASQNGTHMSERTFPMYPCLQSAVISSLLQGFAVHIGRSL